MIKALEIRLDDVKKLLLRIKDNRERERHVLYARWLIMMYRYQEGDCLEVRNHEYYIDCYEEEHLKRRKRG